MVANFELKGWGLFGEEDPLNRWGEICPLARKSMGRIIRPTLESDNPKYSRELQNSSFRDQQKFGSDIPIQFESDYPIV